MSRSVCRSQSFYAQQYDGCIADIIWITQITRKRLNNELLINDWRFDLSGLEVLSQFSADKYRLSCSANLVTEVTHLPFYCVGWCLIFGGQLFQLRVYFEPPVTYLFVFVYHQNKFFCTAPFWATINCGTRILQVKQNKKN